MRVKGCLWSSRRPSTLAGHLQTSSAQQVLNSPAGLRAFIPSPWLQFTNHLRDAACCQTSSSLTAKALKKTSSTPDAALRFVTAGRGPQSVHISLVNAAGSSHLAGPGDRTLNPRLPDHAVYDCRQCRFQPRMLTCQLRSSFKKEFSRWTAAAHCTQLCCG